MATIISMAFPFQQGSSTFPKQAVDDDAIVSSIIQILSTRRGERINRPTFGCNIQDYVFESDSDSMRAGIRREVRGAITQWEPRVNVLSVDVESNEITEPGQIMVTVTYNIITSGRTGSVTVGA